MATLIVQAHPLEDSFSAALCDAAAAQAQSTDPATTTIRLGQGDHLDVDMFTGVTNLVMVYPTWWGSLPAMLLGSLETSLGPWIDGGAPLAKSPLRSVKQLTVITTHGSSRLVNRLQGEPGMQFWKRTVLGLCSKKAHFSWQALYKLDRLTHADRSGFLSTVTVSR